MIVENDCEDQGMTKISDGCFQCPPKVVNGGSKYGRLVRRKFVKRQNPAGSGNWWWYCEGCKGYYGPARPPRGKL